MARVILMLVACLAALNVPAAYLAAPGSQSQEQAAQTALTPEQRAIKVTIATVGSFFGPPTSRYKVGDQIPIAITMTNTSSSPVETCISSNIYQNLPRLTKDGAVVPYMKWQSYERLNAQHNRTCENENLPEPIILKPNDPKLADWFMLVDSQTATGAEAWYDSLTPGKYELTIQRRLACCDGPMVESNKVSFEVVP